MKIKINCEGCGMIHEVPRDNDAPKNAISMGCNFCPKCEGQADGNYDEWYNYSDDDDSGETYDPNQLMLFSISDDILNDKKELQPA